MMQDIIHEWTILVRLSKKYASRNTHRAHDDIDYGLELLSNITYNHLAGLDSLIDSFARTAVGYTIFSPIKTCVEASCPLSKKCAECFRKWSGFQKVKCK
jgi:hypothetical protein